MAAVYIHVDYQQGDVMLTWFRLILSGLAGIAKRQRLSGELSEDLHSHREMLLEENMRRGMSPEEADRRARITLGSAANIHERYRAQAGIPFLEVLWQDPPYAVRILRESPGLTAAAALPLAPGARAPHPHLHPPYTRVPPAPPPYRPAPVDP